LALRPSFGLARLGTLLARITLWLNRARAWASVWRPNRRHRTHRPRFARSQGPLARPTQKDSVRIHTLSHL